MLRRGQVPAKSRTISHHWQVTARAESASTKAACEEFPGIRKWATRCQFSSVVMQQRRRYRYRRRGPFTSQVTVGHINAALSLLTLTLTPLLLGRHGGIPHLKVVLVAAISSIWIGSTTRRYRYLRRGHAGWRIARLLPGVPVCKFVAMTLTFTRLGSSSLEKIRSACFSQYRIWVLTHHNIHFLHNGTLCCVNSVPTSDQPNFTFDISPSCRRDVDLTPCLVLHVTDRLTP